MNALKDFVYVIWLKIKKAFVEYQIRYLSESIDLSKVRKIHKINRLNELDCELNYMELNKITGENNETSKQKI